MRRSTAAAVGTLTGAALILGVRLTASAPVATSAAADPAPSSPASAVPAGGKAAAPSGGKAAAPSGGKAAADDSGLKDGRYRGRTTDYAYGRIQVSLTVDGGKIVAADAVYPVTANPLVRNADAIRQLKQETLAKQSAKVDAVSGATLTSAAYKTSLQAALDAARA
jgi:uncharacterized protein with FMN-binding domain